MTLSVAVAGASGYAGGELLRILAAHPDFEIRTVTAHSNAGHPLIAHQPHLRSLAHLTLQDTTPANLAGHDVVFLALPHGVSMEKLPEVRDLAPVIVDLSSDFRLNDPAGYPTWYSHEHTDLEALGKFVYGMPELHREEIRTADWIASPGCMSTTAIIGLYPLFQAGVVDPAIPVVVEAKTGSSGSGGSPGLSSHHPERAGVVRSFKPTGHRHTAEIVQECTFNGVTPQIAFSATSTDAVRGIVATSHVFTTDKLADKDLWKIYRAAYKDEPFMRIVKESSGIHRYPEPKILSGSNYCDVGWERDPDSNRIVVLAALDNLMKGAAGQALQAFNLRLGFCETLGLEFAGLHPI